MRSAWRGLSLLACSVLAAAAHATTVYKYQDDSGRWHFSDRKPANAHDTVHFEPARNTDSDRPRILYRTRDPADGLVAVNPWFAPVYFCLDRTPAAEHCQLVDANSQTVLEDDGQRIVWQSEFHFRYTLGRPDAQFDGQPLRPPVPAHGRYYVTQGFNGGYSHHAPHSRYAVDIAMNVGDTVSAARAGTVVMVKDDYHMGGADAFFLDKANLVRVLHGDGTIAVYAHLLLGSAQVKPGEKVTVGQALGRAGSSGYSTGPHLHFVLQTNRHGRVESIPFVFQLASGTRSPLQGQWFRPAPLQVSASE